MKIAFISDLHANLAALEAVLADIDSVGVDQTICLGDIASLGPQPGQVVSRSRALGFVSIRGNHDSLTQESPVLRELEEWTLQQLDKNDTDYLRSLPSEFEVQLGDLKLLCVHGSPRSLDEQLLASTATDELEAISIGFEFDLLVCGHTHVQLLRRLNGRTIVGVGSVGMPFLAPFDGSSAPRVLKRSEYAIVGYEGGNLTIDLRQLSYDFEAYRRSVQNSGMPYQEWWCEQWI